jgi:hypothetical protein
MLIFSLFHLVVLYAMQRLQNHLPIDPQGFDPVAPDLAFNTSMSFVTNTNWQNYVPEQTLTHFVQMLGLTVHNFLSPAVGLAMAVALARAFTRSESRTIGNFWVDARDALRDAAARRGGGPRARRARRAADLARLGRRHDARRREAGDFARAKSAVKSAARKISAQW